MTSPTSSEAPPRELPPVVRELRDAPTPTPHGWATTIAPAFLGVIVWFPLLDGFGQAGASSTILSRWATACLALLACYTLVFLPLAGLGLRERMRLPVVAADALGADGAEWIAGVLHGLLAGVWGSVAIWYSVRMTLDGLCAWGMLEPSAVRAANAGELESPLVLTALAFWSFIIVSAVGIKLTGVIEAMMRVYWPFAGLLFVAAACWAWLRGLPTPGPVDPGSALHPRTFQYLFSAFSFAGLMAVEWGGAVRERRDIHVGGFAGLLGPGLVAFLAASVLAAVGAGGSIRSALVDGVFGPWAGGGLLLLFGLASLAPAIFATDLFRSRFRRHWSALQGRGGALLGFLILFLPGATAVASGVQAIAAVAGVLFTPLAGILAAESLRRRPKSMQQGWSSPGVVSWIVGTAAALAGTTWLDAFPPAALMGYVSAATVYLMLSPHAKAEP